MNPAPTYSESRASSPQDSSWVPASPFAPQHPTGAHTRGPAFRALPQAYKCPSGPSLCIPGLLCNGQPLSAVPSGSGPSLASLPPPRPLCPPCPTPPPVHLRRSHATCLLLAPPQGPGQNEPGQGRPQDLDRKCPTTPALICKDQVSRERPGVMCLQVGLRPTPDTSPGHKPCPGSSLFPTRHMKRWWKLLPQSSCATAGLETRQVHSSPSDAPPATWLGCYVPRLCHRAQATCPPIPYTHPALCWPLMFPTKAQLVLLSGYSSPTLSPACSLAEQHPPSAGALPPAHRTPRGSQPLPLPHSTLQGPIRGDQLLGLSHKPTSVLQQGPQQPALARPGAHTWSQLQGDDTQTCSEHLLGTQRGCGPGTDERG